MSLAFHLICSLASCSLHLSSGLFRSTLSVFRLLMYARRIPMSFCPSHLSCRRRESQMPFFLFHIRDVSYPKKHVALVWNSRWRIISFSLSTANPYLCLSFPSCFLAGCLQPTTYSSSQRAQSLKCIPTCFRRKCWHQRHSMPLSSARNFIPCTFSSFFLVSTLLSLPSVSAVNLRRSPSPSSPPSPGGSPGAYSLYPYPDSDPNPIVPDYSYGSPPSQSSTSGAGAQDYGYPQNFSEPQNPYSQSSYPQDDYAQDPTYPQDPYARSPSSQNLYSQDPSSSIPYSPIPGTENPYTSANDTSSIGNISYNSPFGSPISHLTAGSSPNIAEYLTNPDVEPIALCSPNSSSDPPDSTGCHYAMTDLKGEVKWYDKSGPTDWGPSGSGTEAVCGKQWTGCKC